MWTELSKPWQACLELALEAYWYDCIPIGAVVTGPDTRLETIVVALFTEQDAHFHNDQFPAGVFWEMYAKTLPQGIGLGRRLYEQGKLKTLRKNCVAACDVYDRLALLGK
jgi:hypothetical protein